MKIARLVHGNHSNNSVHLYDTICLIKNFFALSGIKVVLSKHIVPNELNILIENFCYNYIHGESFNNSLKYRDTDFIVIATEFLTGETFNDFSIENPKIANDKGSYYYNKPYWKRRYNCFKHIINYSSLILHLNESQAKIYQTHFPNNRISFLPHIYFSSNDTYLESYQFPKDFDIFFSGNLTNYRSSILDELENKNLKIITLPADTQPFLRNDIAKRARIAVNIKQHNFWEHYSDSRIAYHLTNGPYLVSQYCKNKSTISNFIDISDKNDFCDYILHVLLSNSLEENHKSKVEQFIHYSQNDCRVSNLINLLSSYEVH